jgi:oligogalacturonide lyase
VLLDKLHGIVQMNRITTLVLSIAAIVAWLASTVKAQSTAPAMPGKVQSAPIPDEFIDPETHLRVVHLSRFPNDYSGVIYFTYNTFSADSRLALIDAQFKDKWRYLYTFDFGSMTVKPLVTDRLTQNQVVAAKSGNVYFEADHAAWVIPLTGGTPRKLCDLPARWSIGTGFTVNADETLLLGGSVDGGPVASTGKAASTGDHSSRVLFTVDLKTGQLRIIHEDNIEFGHVQFSPTDPHLCMFCWEGNWEKVDRLWFINPSKSAADATGNITSNARIAYRRTEPREIVGHEFWHPDGKSIWFQQGYRAHPERGGFLTSMDVTTGKITQYKIPNGFNGIHETFSPDGTFLVADGNGKEKTGPEKYISKLTLPTDGSNVLRAERLVTMQNNDYVVEPNPHVSADNHWVIFTATLHGTAQAYAVELPRK